MEIIFYWIIKSFLFFLQCLPLRWVGFLGRCGGGAAFHLDRRHRNVTIDNLTLCFGSEKTAGEIKSIARENFKRIGESFASAVKTAAIPASKIESVVKVSGVEKFYQPGLPYYPNIVFAVGHFGNFEVLGRCNIHTPEYKIATTYRGLRQPKLNQLLLDLRTKSGAMVFERRSQASALKEVMSSQGILLGLFADQHAGDKGLHLPFFGHECSTSAAPAVFALRYNTPLYTCFCFRTSLARWSVEVGDEISTSLDGKPRSTLDIMLDVNRSFEKAIRRDPANWFWVHNRWKWLKQKKALELPKV
ncbi:MAG: KDO2-lipid lauroyltransferase [Verrucomicrobiales bacterium]|nr:KDO2-lipid lauroyltransferase [Verrucomicrobiales bacterium]